MKRKGFTLVEMIVTIALISIIATIGSLLLNKGLNTYFKAKELTTHSWQADLALQRMKRELRLATSFVTTTGSQIKFVTTEGDTIRYWRNNNNILLRKQNNNPAKPLAENITALNFIYRDSNGHATGSNIYYISMLLNVTRADSNATFRTTIHPRNLT